MCVCLGVPVCVYVCESVYECVGVCVGGGLREKQINEQPHMLFDLISKPFYLYPSTFQYLHTSITSYIPNLSTSIPI